MKEVKYKVKYRSFLLVKQEERTSIDLLFVTRKARMAFQIARNCLFHTRVLLILALGFTHAPHESLASINIQFYLYQHCIEAKCAQNIKLTTLHFLISTAFNGKPTDSMDVLVTVWAPLVSFKQS